MEKVLVCKDCEKEFILTEGEVTFYKEKGLTEPLRCPECRKVRKQEKINRRNKNHEVK